jgi:hypothetical protein
LHGKIHGRDSITASNESFQSFQRKVVWSNIGKKDVYLSNIAQLLSTSKNGESK